jgi:hypothetical protein
VQNYKTKITFAFATGFMQLINRMLTDNICKADDDKLMLAALVELKEKIYVKMKTVKKDYTLTVSPAQAIAMRVLYTNYINNPTTFMGNKLMLISNEVEKLYTNVN